MVGADGRAVADRPRRVRRPPRGRPRDAAAVRRPGRALLRRLRGGRAARAGHEERVVLWQLMPLLVHAALFGGGWGDPPHRRSAATWADRPAAGSVWRMEVQVADNPAESRYEARVDGRARGLRDVPRRGRTPRLLPHARSTRRTRARASASELVTTALGDMRERGIAVVPLCPFFASFIRRHPEWHDVLAPELRAGSSMPERRAGRTTASAIVGLVRRRRAACTPPSACAGCRRSSTRSAVPGSIPTAPTPSRSPRSCAAARAARCATSCATASPSSPTSRRRCGARRRRPRAARRPAHRDRGWRAARDARGALRLRAHARTRRSATTAARPAPQPARASAGTADAGALRYYRGV